MLRGRIIRMIQVLYKISNRAAYKLMIKKSSMTHDIGYIFLNMNVHANDSKIFHFRDFRA